MPGAAAPPDPDTPPQATKRAARGAAHAPRGPGWYTRASERAESSRAFALAAPFVIVLLSWHGLLLEPEPSLDNSWGAAMHMAHQLDIHFGDRLVFTYGPLGFLSVPTLWYSGTAIIAFLYTILVRLAFAAVVFVGARRTFGTLAGALAALVVADASSILRVPGTSGVTLETVPFFAVCVWALDRTLPRRRLLWLMAGAGAIAGVELLNKESVGIELAALAVVLALAARGRRREQLLVTVGAGAVALLAAWGASGQAYGALSAYFKNGAQIVFGYASAMAKTGHTGTEGVAGWAAFAFGIAGVVHMTAHRPDNRRRWILALWVVFCFFGYKDGFVRHHPIQTSAFFVSMLGGFLAFRWRPFRRPAAAAMAILLLIFAIASQRTHTLRVFNPIANAKSAIDQIGEVASSSERDRIKASGRRAIETAYPIDPATMALLRGHTVHVYPYQVAVAWAYHLDWRPLPVFQSYSAYTTALDRLDANALNSPRAPQRILRPSIDHDVDGRVLAFSEPIAARTILCRYRELRTTYAWQVLALGPNRCQAPVPLGTVHAGWRERVPVPAAPNDHSFVFVSIGGVAVGGIERMVALLYKPAIREVRLRGVSHRFVPGTAMDGLILRAPTAVDYTPPYNLASNSSTIAVAKAGRGATSGHEITYSFFAQPLTAPAR